MRQNHPQDFTKRQTTNHFLWIFTTAAIQFCEVVPASSFRPAPQLGLQSPAHIWLEVSRFSPAATRVFGMARDSALAHLRHSASQTFAPYRRLPAVVDVLR